MTDKDKTSGAGKSISDFHFPKRSSALSKTQSQPVPSEANPPVSTDTYDGQAKPVPSVPIGPTEDDLRNQAAEAARSVSMDAGFTSDQSAYHYKLLREARTQISLKQVPVSISETIKEVVKQNQAAGHDMSVKSLVLMALAHLGQTRPDLIGAEKLARIPDWDSIKQR